MAKKKVDKKDMLRVLLTEVLPYEVPLTFNNEGLYDFLRERHSNDKKIPTLLKHLTNTSNYTIPYDYLIKKSAGKKRKLSIIHPAMQYSFVDFYTSYESIILSQCCKSDFSLRYPANIAVHYYEKDLLNEEESDVKSPHVDPDLNGFAEQSKYSTSFFLYKKYNFLYKFYDSYEFHRLEKKFNTLLKFDISKCFHTIYTHSISWAIKDKPFAKENTFSASFENNYDKIMQKSNYNETNGIVVGPEFSRIFAEIILQSVDNKVMLELKSQGINLNSDYQVKRYVDDYFIFSNSESLCNKIKTIFSNKLSEFKLHLNDAKTELHSVPYISDLSIAKIELYEMINDRFNGLKNESSKLKETSEEEEDTNDVFSINLISYPSRLATKTIRDIKCIIKSNGVNYESVSGFILSTIRRHIDRAYKDFEKLSTDSNNDIIMFNFLYYCLDVSYFIYSMDCRVRTTYLIGHLVITIFNLRDNLPSEYIESLEKKVFDESLLVLRKHNRDKDETIEVFNLIISLSSLSSEYRIPKKDLESVFPPFNEYTNWTYFHFTTIIFYMGDDDKYLEMKNEVKGLIIDFFKEMKKSLIDTQRICLFFDLISCPYLEKEFKVSLCEVVMTSNSISITSESISATINYIDKRQWFTCWDAKNLQLAKILMKKELRSAYE